MSRPIYTYYRLCWKQRGTWRGKDGMAWRGWMGRADMHACTVKHEYLSNLTAYARTFLRLNQNPVLIFGHIETRATYSAWLCSARG